MLQHQLNQPQFDEGADSSCDPLISFAIPIYNGECVIARLLDLLLAQDFEDFEIVVSDNASTDRTGKICQEYARREPRVRYFRNPENIGLLPNFNRLINLARGKYFRWVGGGDWLEPDYARKCIAALDANPDAIGVTTYFAFHREDGSQTSAEYQGERLASPFVVKRFARLTWFMYHDYRYMDMIYTMVRRDVLQKIGGHRFDIFAADQVLAMETCLSGSITHVPECLAHRSDPIHKIHHELLRQNFHYHFDKVKDQTLWDLIIALWATLDRHHQNFAVKVQCVFPLAKFYLTVQYHRRLADLRHYLKLVKQLRLKRLFLSEE
jgi:glycosyltransferase involved in cell wall biosynthesis